MCVGFEPAAGSSPAAARPSRALRSRGARNQKATARATTTSATIRIFVRRTAAPRFDLCSSPANGLNMSVAGSASGGSFQSAATGAARLVLACSSSCVAADVVRRRLGIGFAFDHRFFVSALFGLGAAARLDQRRFGQALVLVRGASAPRVCPRLAASWLRDPLRHGQRLSPGARHRSARVPGASYACTRRSAPAVLRAGWRHPSPHIACRNRAGEDHCSKSPLPGR